jgi:DnaJ-class molecular chaperone
MGQYHDTLGVDPKATKDEIKKAYRKLAKQYHPDTNREESAKAKFLEITEAYEGLQDGRSGPDINQSARDYAKNHFGGDPMDFIREMARRGGVFSHMSQQTMEGKINVIQKVRIPVRTFLAGGTTTLQYNTPSITDQGIYYEHVTKEFVIPKGAKVGQSFTYANEGGANSKGEKGDLIIQLFADDEPPYEIHNAIDIVANIQLDPFDIMLGCTKKIRHPDGVKVVKIEIPPGGHPQNVYAEFGGGLSTVDGRVGDLLLQGHLNIPVLNTKQRETLAAAVKKIRAQEKEVDSSDDDEVILVG